MQKPSGLKPPTRIGKPGLKSSTASASTSSTAASLPSQLPGMSTKTQNEFDRMAEVPHSSHLAFAIFTSDDLPKKKKFSDASVILTENTDDFIIGDRVWVGGTKPGHIQYIGETQFAPGDWAGVVLDDPIGKNDGSVAGVRYFMCEPKRGVFSRLTKLTKEPIQHLIDEEREAIESLAPANGSIRSESPRLSVPNRGSTHTSPASSVIGVRKPGDLTSPSALNRSIENETGLKINDRVIVSSTSGSKTGTLRYLGSTEFAAGEWAGVELDDPVGKNDGSVAGKRYFECKMKYGLFAPIHKVSKSPSSGIIKRGGTPSSRLGSSNLQRRSGSHESLTSSISSASSIARASRVRLGITSLKTGQKVGRSPASVSATHVALQELRI